MNLKSLRSELGQAGTTFLIITGTVALIGGAVYTFTGGVLLPGSTIEGQVEGTSVSITIPTYTIEPTKADIPTDTPTLVPTDTPTGTSSPTPTNSPSSTFTPIPPTPTSTSTPALSGIGGHITLPDSSGLAGVNVGWNHPYTTSDANGSYYMPYSGSWTIKAWLDGYTFSPSYISVMAPITNANFIAQPVTATVMPPTPTLVIVTVTPTASGTPTQTPAPSRTPVPVTPNATSSPAVCDTGIAFWTDGVVTKQSAWDAVVSNRWESTDAPEISLGFEVLGGAFPYRLGDKIPAGQLTIRVEVTDPITKLVTLSLTGAVSRTVTANGAAFLALEENVKMASGTWFRVEAYRADGKGLISAPVWVQ